MKRIVFTVIIIAGCMLLTVCNIPNNSKPTTYILTVTSGGAETGESVSSDVNRAEEGAIVILTANLNSCRQVTLSASGVTINPDTISINGGTATFTMPAAAVEVTATFENTAGHAVAHTANTVVFNMHFVPSGGRFIMGEHVESVTKEVTLTRNFWIGETEVTQGLWEDVWGTTWPGTDPEGSGYGSGNYYPAYFINWYEAVAFCNLLTEADNSIDDNELFYYSDGGLTTAYNKANAASLAAVYVDWSKTGYRLPTEAEWEYAARYIDGKYWNGGDYVSGGPVYTDETDPDKIGDYAWYTGNNLGSAGDPTYGSKAVAQKTTNALGLHDMSGNMREWCYDFYVLFSGGSETDPTGPASGSSRIARGGRWDDSGDYLRCAARNYSDPSFRVSIGFRIARTAD